MCEKRVTVDFDTESYYLDGEYWESWDNYGEEMADAINKEFDKLHRENKELKLKLASISREFSERGILTEKEFLELIE